MYKKLLPGCLTELYAKMGAGSITEGSIQALIDHPIICLDRMLFTDSNQRLDCALDRSARKCSKGTVNELDSHLHHLEIVRGIIGGKKYNGLVRRELQTVIGQADTLGDVRRCESYQRVKQEADFRQGNAGALHSTMDNAHLPLITARARACEYLIQSSRADFYCYIRCFLDELSKEKPVKACYLWAQLAKRTCVVDDYSRALDLSRRFLCQNRKWLSPDHMLAGLQCYAIRYDTYVQDLLTQKSLGKFYSSIWKDSSFQAFLRNQMTPELIAYLVNCCKRCATATIPVTRFVSMVYEVAESKVVSASSMPYLKHYDSVSDFRFYARMCMERGCVDTLRRLVADHQGFKGFGDQPEYFRAEASDIALGYLVKALVDEKKDARSIHEARAAAWKIKGIRSSVRAWAEITAAAHAANEAGVLK